MARYDDLKWRGAVNAVEAREQISVGESTTAQQLGARLRAGDPESTEMLEAALRCVRRIIRHRVKNGSRVRALDDVMQSVTRRLLESKGEASFENLEHLENYLCKIALRVIRSDAVSSRKIEFRTNEELDECAADDSLANASKPVIEREQVNWLRGMLTEEERSLIDARMSGDSWKALALRFHCSPDTARKRFKRVMERLAESDLDDE